MAIYAHLIFGLCLAALMNCDDKIAILAPVAWDQAILTIAQTTCVIASGAKLAHPAATYANMP
jgi:hypothetical protein